MKKVRIVAIVVALLTIGLIANIQAARYSVATGSWSSTSTWSATSGGTSGASVPTSSDAVIIEGGDNVTVNISNAVCLSLQLGSPTTGGGAGTITFSASSQLTVSGNVIMGNSGSTSRYGTITMTTGGTLICQGIGSYSTADVFTEGTGTLQLTATNTFPLSDAGGEFTALNNLVISSGTITLGTALTLGGTLTINDGATLTAAAFALTVTGTTTVGGGASGSLVISSATGTKIFTGLVTINAGATWNNSGNSAITFQGGITNNNTFTAGSGVQTFNINAQALTGTFSIPNVTVTTITLTNNNTLTVGTALSGTGGLTQAASAALNIGGTSGITTLTATNSGNTVNYTGAAQTVHSNTYYNLILSGSGTKTAGGAITASNTLTNSVTLDMVGYTLSAGSITNTGGTIRFSGLSNGLAIGTGTVEYYGTTQNVATGTYATLNITATGTKTAGGAITATTLDNGGASNVAAILDMAGNTLTATTLDNTGATIRFNGATNGVVVSTGTVEYYGTTQNVATGTYATLNITATGTKTAGGAITATTLDNGGASNVAAILDMAGNTLTATTLDNTGATIRFNGATNGVAVSTGTVEYYGAAQTVATGTYNNLTLSGSDAKTLQTGTTTISGDLTLSGTATTTTVVGLVISGDLVIGDGTTFTAAGFALTVTGTTTVGGGLSGNLTISSATGAKLFTGLVTINAGAIWNNSGSSAITFRGGITNNNIFTTGTGMQIFSTNSQALTGTFSMPSVTVTGVTLTNNGTLTVTMQLAGTGGLTNAGTGTLNINFTGAVGITTLTATASGNTVNYGYAGTQTVAGVTYNNLTLSNSGTKTLSSATITNGTLTIENSVTLATGNFALTFGGDFVNSGTFSGGSSNITISGTSAQNIDGFTTTGTIYITKTSNTATFTDDANASALTFSASGATLSINSGKTLAISGAVTLNSNDANVSCTITGNGTLSAGSVTVGTDVTLSSSRTTAMTSTISNFNISGNLTINSTQYSFYSRYNNATFNHGSGTVTVNGSVTTSNEDGSNTSTFTMATGAQTGTLVLAGATPFTIDGTGTSTITLNGTGATVNYARNGDQPVRNVTYYNLTTSGSGTKTLGGTITISGSLTINDGTTFADGGNQLTSTGTLNLNSGTFKLGSAGTATTFPAFATRNITAGTTVEYASGQSQTVSTTPSYPNLTFSGAGTKTITTGTLTIGGNWEIQSNCQINTNDPTVNLTGNLSILGGTTNASNTAAFNIGGDFNFNSGTFTHNNGTVTFNGTSQTIYGANASNLDFYNLTISSGTSCVLGRNIRIVNNLNITSGDVFDLATYTANRTTSGGTLTVAGTMRLGATSGGQPGSNFPTNFSIWTLTGTGGTVEYYGSGQTVATGHYNNLTINQSSGNATLGGTSTVNGTLTLTSGNINTGADTMIISSTGSVSRTSGHIVGNLKKHVATGTNVVRRFEIGDASNYTADSVVFASVTTAGYLTSSTASGDHANISSSNIDPDKSVNRHWTMTKDAILAFNNYSATFNFVSGDIDGGGTDYNNFIVGKYDGSTWTYPTVNTKTSTSTQATGMDAFCDFQIGEEVLQRTITFNQSGIGSDPSVNILKVDGTNYIYTDLPKSFTWDNGSSHTYQYYDTLTNGGNRYIWTSTTRGAKSGSITVSNDSSLIGNYSTQYKLRMAANFGTTSPSLGTHWYDAGTVLTISATAPAAGAGEQYVFSTGWTGTGAISYTGTNNPATNLVTMNSAIAESAAWTHQWQLRMAANFGTTTPAIGTSWQNAGAVVNISATAPSVGAGEQYVFSTGWAGTGTISYTGTTNASSVTMNSAIAESAAWTRQYYLTVSSVYATPGGSGWYGAGTNAYATVTPETIPVSPGIRILFSGWSNGATGSHSPSDPIYMDGPKTAVGSWGLSTYLTVISAHSTTSGEGWYNAWLPYTARAGVTDSIVTEGSTRYIFTGWSGDATGTHLISDNINMDWPRIATATWTTQFYLTVNNGHSTAGGAAWYDSSATAYASVADSIVTSGTTQYIFKQWTIDASGTYLTSNGILMDAAKTATATWTTQFYLTVNNGGHSTVGGAAWYDSSATAYATVTDSIVAGSAGTQYVFKQWTVDASGTHLTSNGILMDAPKTASVTWTTQYYLTLATLPPGITTPTGDGWYNASSLVPINTAPSVISLPDTYYFAKWTTGDMTEIIDSLALSTTVFMDIPKTVTANYAQGSRDVGVDSIIQPADTVTICIPFNPVIRVVNNTFPSTVETCTLDVKIWRFRVKYDSLCHISVNVLDSVMLYDTSVVISIPYGFTNITLTKQWHPLFADLTYLSSPTYHRVRASVRMAGDENPSNDSKTKKFTVKDRRYDLQVNYAGLLRGKVLTPETITTGVAYNSFSVVSNSPSGPSVSFRSWFKIIRMKNNIPYYSQYIDRTLAAGTYACIYYSSGWNATDTGLYKVVSYIETRPGLDSVPGNNQIERYYYVARLSSSGPMGEVSTLPQTFGLMQNSPNPFSGLTAIRWQIPSESRVTISIYDATGRVIKTIENGNYLAGYYNSVWNCTDDHNRKVSAGIYFYELRANNYIARHKMIITR